MKLRVALLLVSLAVNGALVAALVGQFPALTNLGVEIAGAVNPATDPAPAKTAAAQNKAGTSSSPVQIWSLLRTSDDLPTLIARLRAAGFPPSVVRSVVAAEIGEQFAARRKELTSQQTVAPYWKNQFFSFYDPKATAALRVLSRKESDLLKQLLGPDPSPANDMLRASMAGQFGNLPPEKIDQLQSILSDYSEMSSQVYATANGMMLPEDRAQLALLEKEQRVDLAALLTPQELEEYNLRNSSTTGKLRSQLATFNPTEDEFRAIFKIQQAFDDQFGSTMAMTMEQRRQYTEAQKQLLPQIQAVLTPDRFAAYQQAIDPAYQQINRLVARLDLPPETSTQVVALQKDIQQRAMAVQTARDVTPDDRAAQLAALNQEATNKLTQSLGARGFEAYKTNGGYWLQMLQPRSAAGSATPGSGTTRTIIQSGGGTIILGP
jgi:hypothetical protein